MKKTNITPKKSKSQFTHLVHIFVSAEKRALMNDLCSAVKKKLSFMTEEKDAYKKEKLVTFGKRMWYDFKDEFYMTGDISEETLWKWQDGLGLFDEQYLHVPPCPEYQRLWLDVVESWYDIRWAIEVMKLVKQINLDNFDYIGQFITDFQKVKNEHEFCSAIYKWTDLTQWSPWKQALLLDCTIPQPANMKYEEEFNPEITDSDEILD